MTHKFIDRVREVWTGSGQGNIQLGAQTNPQTGYVSFASVLANGDTCDYLITDGTEWEVGVGEFSVGTPNDELVRSDGNIYANSDGTHSRIDFSPDVSKIVTISSLARRAKEDFFGQRKRFVCARRKSNRCIQ